MGAVGETMAQSGAVRWIGHCGLGLEPWGGAWANVAGTRWNQQRTVERTVERGQRHASAEPVPVLVVLDLELGSTSPIKAENPLCLQVTWTLFAHCAPAGNRLQLSMEA
jgi:hypothetical protein